MSEEGQDQGSFDSIDGQAKRGLRGVLKRRRHREPTFREQLLARARKET